MLEFCRDYVESVDCFWKDGHFYYVNTTDPWAWDIFSRSFHLLISFSSSFSEDLKFLSYKFSYLDRVISGYFILLVDILSGYFLVNCTSSQFAGGVYQLWKLPGRIFEIFIYTIMSYASGNALSSSFQICIHLISFSTNLILAIGFL